MRSARYEACEYEEVNYPFSVIGGIIVGTVKCRLSLPAFELTKEMKGDAYNAYDVRVPSR